MQRYIGNVTLCTVPDLHTKKVPQFESFCLFFFSFPIFVDPSRIIFLLTKIHWWKICIQFVERSVFSLVHTHLSFVSRSTKWLRFNDFKRARMVCSSAQKIDELKETQSEKTKWYNSKEPFHIQYTIYSKPNVCKIQSSNDVFFSSPLFFVPKNATKCVL